MKPNKTNIIIIIVMIMTVVIAAINIFLICQRQTYINQIDEKIKYLETRHDSEYIEEYLQDHKGE